MEGNEGNLEAHAGDEEHEAEDAQEIETQAAANFIEIECSSHAVDERDAIEQEGA